MPLTSCLLFFQKREIPIVHRVIKVSIIIWYHCIWTWSEINWWKSYSAFQSNFSSEYLTISWNRFLSSCNVILFCRVPKKTPGLQIYLFLVLIIFVLVHYSKNRWIYLIFSFSIFLESGPWKKRYWRSWYPHKRYQTFFRLLSWNMMLLIEVKLPVMKTENNFNELIKKSKQLSLLFPLTLELLHCLALDSICHCIFVLISP